MYDHRHKPKFPISVLILGVIVGLLLSYLGTKGYEITGNKDFCTTCHVMEPMGKSYLMDVHAGKGKYGIKTSCADCHLPNDTLVNCLTSKVKNGVHVVYSQFFKDIEHIDWRKKRKDREVFVYDSACLKCHKNIENANQSNIEAIMAHKEYFAQITGKKCVSCHKNVGHKELGRYLPKNQPANNP